MTLADRARVAAVVAKLAATRKYRDVAPAVLERVAVAALTSTNCF